jgi:type IV pilus assembly protein PilP
MIKFIFLPALTAVLLMLTACSSNNGFSDLDRFMKEMDTKARGRIEPLPEVKVYRAFTYSAANRRSPFLPPEDVVVNDVEIQKDQSTVKPNMDRAKEVLESYALGQLKMVGTLQRGVGEVLWALISDNEGGVHMAKTGQYMGKNYGRIVDIGDGRLDLIEIVPNGYGGWLERPRIITLEDEK